MNFSNLAGAIFRALRYLVAIPVFMFITNFIPVYIVSRYDFVFFSFLFFVGFEFYKGRISAKNLVVGLLFYGAGFIAEYFYVLNHRWYFPEFAFTRPGLVPLYVGFLYASLYFFLAELRTKLVSGFEGKTIRNGTSIVLAIILSDLFLQLFASWTILISLPIVILIEFRRKVLVRAGNEESIKPYLWYSIIIFSIPICLFLIHIFFSGTDYVLFHYGWEAPTWRKAWYLVEWMIVAQTVACWQMLQEKNN